MDEGAAVNYILIGHKKRQGKDTLAALLVERLPDAHILRFADPLKEIVADMFGVSVPTLEAMKNESQIFRAYLQRFGNGKIKTWFDQQVWRDLLIGRAEALSERGAATVVVPDFRFPGEYIDGAVTVCVTGRDHDGDPDESETALDCWDWHYTVENSGTPDDLERIADMLAQSIMERFACTTE